MSKSVDLPVRPSHHRTNFAADTNTVAPVVSSTYLIYKPIPVGGKVAAAGQEILLDSDLPGTSHSDAEIESDPKSKPEEQSSAPFIICSEIPDREESETGTSAVPQCEKCGLVCEGFPQLITHVKKCTDTKLYNCDKCGESFNHQVNFRLHSAIHEGVGDVFTCPECQKSFNRSAAFRCHLALHKVDESISCEECQEEFAFNSQLKRHVLVAHMKQLNQVNYCKICAAVQSSQEELKAHLETHRKIREILKTTKRGKVKKLFAIHACKVCQKVFTRRSALERHEIIHTGQRPHVCSICNMSFTQTGALQYHMAKHMPEKPYKCQLCGMGFTQRGNLRTHVRRVHPTNYDKKSVYPCPVCTCIFKKVQVLNQHVTRLHPEIYPVDKPNTKGKENCGEQSGEAETSGKSPDLVETAMCNSGIGQSQQGNNGGQTEESSPSRLVYKPMAKGQQAEFEAHCNYVGDGIVHSKLKDITMTYIEGKRFLVCPVKECGKLFKKPSDMVRHHRIHTNSRPYKCHLCPQSFKTKHVLVSHLRHHSGLKTVQCQICLKMLSSETSLKHHMKIHLGNELLSCSRCSKSYRSAASFTAHEKRCRAYADLKAMGKTNQPVPDVSRLSKKELMILAKVLPDIKLSEPIKIPQTNSRGETRKKRAKVYECPMCPARFAYSSHRSQHIRTHTRELRFKCYICQKGFIRLDQLHKHLIVHTGVRKPYSCPKCHRSFSTQQSRDRHRFLHEDSRPFLCPYCDKTFKLGKQCRAHIKTHKFAEVVKSYRMKFAEEQRRSQPPTTTANYFDQTSYSGGVQSVMKHDSVSQQQLQLQHKSSYEGTFLYPADVQMFDYTVVSREQQFPNNLRFGCDTGLNTQTNFNPPSTSQQQYSQMAIYTTDNIAGGKSNNLAPVYYTTGRGENSSEPANNQPSDSFQDAFHLIFAENFDVETTRNGHRNRGESVTMRNDNNLLSHMNSFEDAMIMDSSSLDHLTSTIADIFNSEGMAGISALLPNLNLNSSDDLLMSPTDDTTSLTSPNSVYMTNSSQLQSTQQTSVKTSLSQIHLPKLKSTSFNSNDAKTIKLESKEVMDDKLKQLNGDILISEAEELQKCRAKRMIKCPECSIELRSRSLKEHLRRKHSTDKVPVECPVCSQKFSGKMEMKRHRDSKHKDQVKFAEEEQLSKELFSCLVCKTSLSTKEELDQHLIINHVETQQQRSSDVPPSSSVPVECTTGSDPKKCHYCEKNFKKPSDLIRHIRVHTGEKPYSCAICSKAFRTKSTRNYHIKTHTAEGPMYSCPVCAQNFAAKGSLKVHIRIHTNERPLICPHCPESFRTSAQKQQHIKQRHTGIGVEPDGIGQPLSKSTSADLQTSESHLENDNKINSAVTNSGASVSHSANPSDWDYSRISLQFLQSPMGLQLLCRPYLKPVVSEDYVDKSQIILEVSVLEGLAEKGFTITIPVRLNKYGTEEREEDSGELSSVELDPKVLLESARMSGADDTSVPAELVSKEDEPQVSFPSISGSRHQSTSLGADVTLNTPLPDGDSNGAVNLFSPTITDFIDDGAWAGQSHGVNSANNDTKSQIFIPDCPVCGGKFDNAKDSIDHFNSLEHVERLQQERVRDALSGPRLKLHRCQECGKEFDRPSHLQRHQTVHSGEKMFSCSDCGATFGQKSSLTVHRVEGYCPASNGSKPGFRPYRRKSDLDPQMSEIFTDL